MPNPLKRASAERSRHAVITSFSDDDTWFAENMMIPIGAVAVVVAVEIGDWCRNQIGGWWLDLRFEWWVDGDVLKANHPCEIERGIFYSDLVAPISRPSHNWILESSWNEKIEHTVNRCWWCIQHYCCFIFNPNIQQNLISHLKNKSMMTTTLGEVVFSLITS